MPTTSTTPVQAARDLFATLDAEAAATPPGAPMARTALDAILMRRDTVTAGLARGEGSVREVLVPIARELRRALGRASQLVAQNLKQMIQEADVIVTGEVSKVTDGVENGLPFTEVTMKVNSSGTRCPSRIASSKGACSSSMLGSAPSSR